MKSECTILIPALDPPEKFKEYIRELVSSGFTDILVVDDGSADKEIFREIAAHPQVTVLTHEKNGGKGKALRTGMQYYRRNRAFDKYCGVITADSDGQHLCKDVRKIRDRLLEGTDRLVLGVRDFDEAGVPTKSRFGNQLTGFLFRVLLGLSVSDTQTGLRGIPNALIDLCLSIPGDRFEYETSMLIEIGKTVGFEEVKIDTVYYDENRGTHFHPIKDSFRIYRLLFGTFFRYLLTSLSSFLVDILLFALGTKLLFPGRPWRIPVSTAGARVISGAYNFFMNRNVVFKSSNSYVKTGIFYLILCVIQCAASAGLVYAFTRLLSLDEVFVKTVVDACLFLVNYRVQKLLIFGDGADNINSKETMI